MASSSSPFSPLAHPRGLLRVPAAQPVGYSVRGDGHGQPGRGRLSGLLLQGGRRRCGRSAHRRPAQKRGFRGRKGAGRAEKHSGVAAVCGFVGGADGRPSDGGGGEEEVRGGAGRGESGGMGEMQSDLRGRASEE